MKLSQSTHEESKQVKPGSVSIIQISVEALALLLLATPIVASAEALASTGSNWGSQPAWSAPDPSLSPPRKPAYSRESARYRDDVSPFAPGSNNIAVDVGQVFLMGDLGNRYEDAIGAQVHYTYGVSDLFGFDASAGYSDHSSGQLSMTTLLAGLRTNLAWYDKVVPYLVFGLGFYRPSLTVTNQTANGAVDTTVAPVLFGVHLGPGVDLELTKQFFFGAAITFHDVFGTADNKSTNGTATAANTSQSVGGTFTSFFLHVGMTF